MRRLTEFFWVAVPRAARRVSAALVAVTTDGYYLTAWRPIAALAPPLAFVAGLLVGWQHWGFFEVFSQSLLLVCVLVAVGTLSGHVGAWFVGGFAIGDFFLSDVVGTMRQYARFPAEGQLLGTGILSTVAREWLPLVIVYASMAIGAVLGPLLVKGLVSQFGRRQSRLSRNARFGFALVAYVALTGAFVFLWALTVPIAIRPRWVWGYSTTPDVSAVEPVQTRAMVIVTAAMAAALVRMVAQGLTAYRAHLGARMEVLVDRINEAPAVVPLWDRVPAVVRCFVQAAFATLLLGGVFQTWRDGVIVGAVAFVIQLVRAGVIPLPLGGYERLMQRVPLLLRLAVAMVAVYFLARFVLERLLTQTQSLRGLGFVTAGSMIVFFLLNPKNPRDRPGGADEPTRSSPPPTPTTPAAAGADAPSRRSPPPAASP